MFLGLSQFGQVTGDFNTIFSQSIAVVTTCFILPDLNLNLDDTRSNNRSLYLLPLLHLYHLLLPPLHTECCRTQHLPALASQSPSSSPSTACPKPCKTRKVLPRWRQQGWHSPFGFPLFVGIQRCCCRSSRCSWLFCSLEVNLNLKAKPSSIFQCLEKQGKRDKIGVRDKISSVNTKTTIVITILTIAFSFKLHTIPRYDKNPLHLQRALDSLEHCSSPIFLYRQ